MTWARYEALPRPETQKPRGPNDPPPKVYVDAPKPPPWLVGDPVVLRVAQRLGITVRELDERLTAWDVLSEYDALQYLRDVDDRPEATPAERTRILAERERKKEQARLDAGRHV